MSEISMEDKIIIVQIFIFYYKQRKRIKKEQAVRAENRWKCL